MKSNSLTLVGNASQKAFLSVIPGFFELAEGFGKKGVAFALDDKVLGDIEKLCNKATVLSASGDFAAAYAQKKNDGTFVLTVGHAGADLPTVALDAKAAAKVKSPILLLLDVSNKNVAGIEECMNSCLQTLAPCGAYLFASILFGASLTKAEEEALNDKFGKKNESPLYFIAEGEATAASFARAVNTQKLGERLCASAELPMAPGLFELELAFRAQQAKQKIVLAEGEEERILRATEILLNRQVADIVLLGNVDAIKKKASDLHLSIDGAELIDPASSPKFEEYANTYYELRKSKGVTEDDAKKTMRDATVYGTMMVKKGDADGMVSGAINTTAHTIRPALQFVKTKPGFSVVSSCFLMCLADRVLVFGDCAVNPNPTAAQIAEIAVSTAQTAMAFGIEPRVAMISYSSGNSGKGPDVDLVIEATKLAKEKDPSLLIDGPLQYDAAIDPTVAKTKMPNSPVAGRATVFIFPNLTTGNTTYKAVQRACDAIAIGPVLQGLNKPVNDLSRGCLVPDIVNTVAITAVQAAIEK
ncbi:MAG: phosphate acetyltransferase [Desulfovibrionaceae bacterium]|nr:phosphate acetyltransferase [Desulfovibrionaceae bacterium]